MTATSNRTHTSSATVSTYAEARAAELAQRRLDVIRAQGSLGLLRH